MPSLSKQQPVEDDEHQHHEDQMNWTVLPQMNDEQSISSEISKDLTSSNETNNDEAKIESYTTLPTSEASAIAATNSSSCQVRVGVRVRPLTYNERGIGGKSVVSTIMTNDRHSPTITLSTNHKFTYDMVFDTNATQCQLYQSISTPLLNSFLDGYNATVRSHHKLQQYLSLTALTISITLYSSFLHFSYID
jgi:Kinesin motor domain